MEAPEGLKIYQIETMANKTLVMAENSQNAVIKFFKGIENLRGWVEEDKIGGAILVSYEDTNIAISTIPLLLNLRVLQRKEAVHYILSNTNMNPNIVQAFINSQMEKYHWIVEDD